MLKKSNNSATRAAAAAAKKLAEAAAKAVKELISALASLGGGTALFVVFSIVIVAGAFLASPLGILFADEQQTDDTVPLATAIAEIQGEYHSELERLQSGDFSSVQIIGQAPDWREVVAVFASKVAGAEDGMDVFTLDEERVALLRQVFWDMCEITTAAQTVFVPDSDPDDDVDDSRTETALTITITHDRTIGKGCHLLCLLRLGNSKTYRARDICHFSYLLDHITDIGCNLLSYSGNTK